jgi:hypothetical protein
VLEVAAQQPCDGRRREELHALAPVVAACEAGLALAADDVGFDGDTVARLEVRDGGVACHDCAGGFMAENVSVLYDHGSNAALVIHVSTVFSRGR